MRRGIIVASCLATFSACFSFGDLSGNGGPGDGDASNDAGTTSDTGVEGGDCGDTISSAANCGACGNACKNGISCIGGVCGDRVDGIAVAHGLTGTSCVLLHDGTVWCWGSAGYGLRHSDAGVEPAVVPGIDDAVELAIGGNHACVRTEDGGVSCWGNNTFGQIGRASGADENCPNPPNCDFAAPVGLPGGESAKRIFATGDLTCVLTTTNDFQCWGQGANALLERADGGAPLSNFGTYTPQTFFALPSDTTDLAVSASDACLVAGNTETCWGVNNQGSLGHDVGTDGDQDFGLVVNPFPGTTVSFYGAFGEGPNGGPVKSAQITQSYACAIAQSPPLLACWGAGISIPSSPNGLPGTSLVAVSDLSSFTVDIDGTSWAFGSNFNGMLATGSIDGPNICGSDYCAAAPIKTSLPNGISAYALSNIGFGLALEADGGVLAWGANESAELGHATGTGGDLADCHLVKSDAGIDTGMGPCNPTPAPVLNLP